MEIKLINGHNQIIFSENDKKEIIGSYMSGESMRSIQRRYNISAKPLRRLLDENNIDHSRGNLRAYVKNYPDGIYDENIENEIQDKINNLNIRSNHNKYYINRNYFDVIDKDALPERKVIDKHIYEYIDLSTYLSELTKVSVVILTANFFECQILNYNVF